MLKRFNLLLVLVSFFSSCKKTESTIDVKSKSLHEANEYLTKTMVYDIFSPPVASRIYAYSNIAAYEVIAQFNSDYVSLEKQLNGLTAPPQPDSKVIDPSIAALVAFYEIGRSLVFSEDILIQKRDSLFQSWKDKNEEVFTVSEAYGLIIANHIKDWMQRDNYKETRTMPKFVVQTDDVSRWKPTPPAYMDGIEPNWHKIRPFVLDSSNQFKPIPPPEFSMEPGSIFHKQLMEVYEVRNEMGKSENKDEKMAIAKFWDCNPYVSVNKGHLMFATKKITPGGHWIGITQIACEKTGADMGKSIYTYTKTSIAIADGFISCWDEKYRSNLVRPETLINKFINEDWKSVLQTPPFPEYTSGHSVISGSAATVLTEIFGDNFEFDDDTEIEYGLPVRSFHSFFHASLEAANSRLYGGIHYRAAIEVGLEQGKAVGNYINHNLIMSNKDIEKDNLVNH
ncbi:vanadium-dependent haloperoxidase [Autumnicola musiva]|uniref:Vanadium-dependent haloperoxidase n=1 Tax=Autumnicola musiva TaxID=3075589 RepID=A0ABU3D2Z5_9FLAO|nr:vanadium-dependent haloperoxidase [Zunongwangia sp. F117]MDT0675864.1 vanadium-dependent haloperoxidase [Zunongwangia sp. F117]